MSLINKIRGIIGTDEYYEDEYDDDFITKEDSGQKSGGDGRNNKIVNVSTTTQLKVVLVRPEHFEDASSIADHLNDKRTVVINLESTNKEMLMLWEIYWMNWKIMACFFDFCLY